MHLGGSSVGWRRALGRYLLALVLLFTNAGLLPLLAQMVPGCGAQCCRNKKTCCCRKNMAAGTGGLTVSAKTCPGSCGAAVAAAGWMAAGVAAAWDGMAMAAEVGAAGAAVWAWAIVWLCFALFQRPPPVFRYEI